MAISAFETLDFLQRVAPCVLARPAGGQEKARTIVCASQLCGHQQDAFAQGLKRGVLKFRRQAQPFKPVDEIIGEQQQMEVRLVGKVMACRDSTERIVALELSNDQLDSGSIVVEAPEVQRLQFQVGDEDVVVEASEFEQGELSGRLLGLRSSNRNKAKGTWPAMWLIAELGRLDIVADGAVAQTPELAFDGSGQARNDYEAHVLRLDPLDERAVVKSLVCSENHAPAWVRRRQ